jgi:hypothetical protein
MMGRTTAHAHAHGYEDEYEDEYEDGYGYTCESSSSAAHDAHNGEKPSTGMTRRTRSLQVEATGR